ncbi:DUF998 domain-containing protein [Streptomyces yaizuensis]|uniref:DUF998 domain-containing protein n=1 Tax=Streptomyces yaizuensis TaxID=2989713 RepID=A0ABQ5NXD7_9ACTN|nr:DUF998 domain-containing protein [Streptomyces sp. YSPA8]GLF95039.1 DUF998 domain-containing protein [Streptomyces sp. YSPA8]
MTTLQQSPATAATAATAVTTASGVSGVSTRALLGAGAAAAPVWTVVALTQAVTREGFDITRHPLSVLSNGALGWIQIANFAVTGTLMALGAIGLRRTLRGTPGGTWAPWLAFTAGIGIIAAGAFVMDPADGFPVGTPAGPPEMLSGAGIGHMAAGMVAFTSMIAANYVLGRHFSRAGQRGRAVLSRVAATGLLLGNGWAMGGGTWGTLTLAVGVMGAMLWLSAVCASGARVRRGGPGHASR